MSLFTSSREKKLWLWVLVVIAAIFSTLFIGQPLFKLLANQNLQAAYFLLGMALVGATIIVHGLKTKSSKFEISLWLGLAGVYTMLFLRLGLPERSHLMEYSVLAVFIHKAISERINQGKRIPFPAFLSFLITFLIGVMDECLQIFLPNRVFDPEDIVFNGMAAAMAIGASSLLSWGRRKWKKKE